MRQLQVQLWLATDTQTRRGAKKKPAMNDNSVCVCLCVCVLNSFGCMEQVLHVHAFGQNVSCQRTQDHLPATELLASNSDATHHSLFEVLCRFPIHNGYQSKKKQSHSKFFVSVLNCRMQPSAFVSYYYYLDTCQKITHRSVKTTDRNHDSLRQRYTGTT